MQRISNFPKNERKSIFVRFKVDSKQIKNALNGRLVNELERLWLAKINQKTSGN